MIEVSIANDFSDTTKIELSDFFELGPMITKNNWAPGVFDGPRKISNFKHTDVLALDVDGGLSLDDAVNVFAGFTYIIATTKSHQKEKNGIICDRFRVVIPLESRISDIATYNATWENARTLWPFIDSHCKDCSRFYYKSSEMYMNVDSKQLFPITASLSKTYQKPAMERTSEFLPAYVNYLRMFGAPEGGRNSAIFKASCDLFRCGYTEQEVVALLSDVSTLDEREVFTAINSAYNTIMRQNK